MLSHNFGLYKQLYFLYIFSCILVVLIVIGGGEGGGNNQYIIVAQKEDNSLVITFTFLVVDYVVRHNFLYFICWEFGRFDRISR